MTVQARKLRSKLPALIGGVFLLLFTAAVIYGVKSFMDNAKDNDAPRVQKISLVKPPPPKDLPKPPEPEKIEQEPPKEEVQLDQPPDPQEAANEAPPGENLAVEGEGGAGGDAFGLVGKKGVRELNTIGGGGDRQAWYSWMIKRQFEGQLRKNKALQGVNYRVAVEIWFDDGGAVRKVQLSQGTGNADLDRAIRVELQGSPPLEKPLPPDVPQPVRVRVTSQG